MSPEKANIAHIDASLQGPNWRSVVLRRIHDALCEETRRLESLEEQLAKIPGANAPNAKRLSTIKSLDAAASIVLFAIGEGQKAATSGKPAPQWLSALCGQARGYFVASEQPE